MRRLVMAAVLTLIFPAIGAAEPCLPGSLEAYKALGSTGCTIGSATVNDFDLVNFNPLASPIAAADISVTPVDLGAGLRLDFGVGQDAGAGEFFGGTIAYSLSALGIRRARLSMEGAAASPDGVVTGVEDLCAGDVFASDPTNCLGTPLPPLIVFEAGFANELVAEMSFAPTSFFDVFTEIAIDGGLAGTASLNGIVSNEFSSRAVPEPSVLLLFGTTLVALARRHRQSNTQRRP